MGGISSQLKKKNHIPRSVSVSVISISASSRNGWTSSAFKLDEAVAILEENTPRQKAVGTPPTLVFPYPPIKSLLDLGEEKKVTLQISRRSFVGFTAWKTYPDGGVISATTLTICNEFCEISTETSPKFWGTKKSHSCTAPSIMVNEKVTNIQVKHNRSPESRGGPGFVHQPFPGLVGLVGPSLSWYSTWTSFKTI